MRTRMRNKVPAPLLVIPLPPALALGGCVFAEPQGPYYASEVVTVAPPPPREEIIGVAPAVGYVWIGGYWGWTGGRHEWGTGRWGAPPPRDPRGPPPLGRGERGRGLHPRRLGRPLPPK